MEARCKRADVEAKKYEALELGRHAAGLGRRRGGGIEIWSSGGAL